MDNILALLLAKKGGGTGGSADWNASEGEAGHVKNRTHYEETTVVNEPLSITWDGNADGLVAAQGAPFYKISDIVLIDEQIKTVTEVISNGTIFVVSEYWGQMFEFGFVTDDVVLTENVAYVRKAGANIMDMHGGDLTFPEVGIYFVGDTIHVASITTSEPIEHTKTVIKKLDIKYLPIEELKEALGIGGGPM